MSPSSTGRVRALVPFFVPSPDGSIVVNDSLSLHTSTTSLSSAPPRLVELPVRAWDHDAGVFRDAVHVVRDLPAAPPVPNRPARLLTPADIRAARQAAKDAAAPKTRDHPVPSQKQKTPLATRTRSPISVEPTPEQPKTPSPNKIDRTSSPSKSRAFAGSTFESASPPPGGLPIPAFVRRPSASPEPVPKPRMKDVVEPALMETDAREQAAVDLRRMLKI